MKCKKIQELILTDYTDQQLGMVLQKQIEEHLNKCGHCKQFEQAIRRITVEPFKNAQRMIPPEHVWYNIKNKIQNNQSKPIYANIIEKVRFIFMPKPVFALATITSIILIAFILSKLPTNDHSSVNAYLQEQIQSIAELAENGEESYYVVEGTDLDTTIEKYLI